ncbi:MAG: potassium-transporting ATPase subunit A, partial [Clostridiales bacterium]|nr:potassium-transporting ATPase subunit A [Clostridiales bacterium]
FVGYLILRLQGLLFLNPNGIEEMESSLSFNTIISFMTNTNLQHYSGESGLSYFSQITVIVFMMFTSAATGYAACMAFCRGLAGKGKDLGNFYEDMIRITTRILIPVSILVGLILVSQGTPQTFDANITVHTIEGKLQDLAMGPVAALESIKHLGTNGGGFFGANSTTPFENPTIISNITELISMMILPGACVVTFGRMVQDERKAKGKKLFFGNQGRTIFAAMAIIFVIGLTVCYVSEKAGNPVLAEAGLNQDMGSMEGKEVRFGIAQSALFTTVTTSFTTGTVNNMHDTLTPLGGMVPLLHMMLNCVFGGKGVGLMNMIMYAILTVFICGLMIGRTPEYLGKKIEGREMKLVALVIIIHPLLILGFSALAVATTAGLEGITNPGFHGLSQVLYEYASSAANNGSGFEGLADNTTFWNVTTGLAMFFGRYLAIIAQLAIAGSLLAKKRVNESIGTLRTDNTIFAFILVFIVYIFAALTFLPALSLGPIAEHLMIWF